jgi:hypothetical protein
MQKKRSELHYVIYRRAKQREPRLLHTVLARAYYVLLHRLQDLIHPYPAAIVSKIPAAVTHFSRGRNIETYILSHYSIAI